MNSFVIKIEKLFLKKMMKERKEKEAIKLINPFEAAKRFIRTHGCRHFLFIYF